MPKGVFTAVLVASFVVLVSAPSAQASPVKVKIVNFKFKPGTLSIPRGTKVKWTNKAVATNHTTTSDTGLWNKTLAPGATFKRTFNTVGTFKYHCQFHASFGMTGKVIVKP